MHQTKKGNQWHFRMKAHIEVDVASGWCTVTGTAANEADINQTASLLHGREGGLRRCRLYRGGQAELEDCDVDWNIAIKRSIIKALPKDLPIGRGNEGVVAGAGLGRAPVPHRQSLRHKGCAIAAWPRTQRNCTPCSRWPTW
jgi:IS5 family transposase